MKKRKNPRGERDLNIFLFSSSSIFEDGYLHVLSIFTITLQIFLELFSDTTTQKPQVIHSMIKHLAFIQKAVKAGRWARFLEAN